MNRSAAAGRPQLGVPAQPLHREDDDQALGRAGEQRGGDGGALEDADPGAAAQDLRVLRPAADPDRGGVGGAQHGGGDRAAAGDRGERPRASGGGLGHAVAGRGPPAQASAPASGEQDRRAGRRRPGRAHPLARGR